MVRKQGFPIGIYCRKILNTFLPRFFFRLSPQRMWARNHWKNQSKGDIHGFDKYTSYHPRVQVILDEIRSRVQNRSSILDLGCNCGYYLAQLKKEGFGDLSGIDISPAAIRYGQDQLGLQDIHLITGSFEDVLPELVSKGKKFDLVYTLGATVELVHPSFDVIGHMCTLSDRYVICIISEWAHEYPRFWEYEFFRNGFWLVKCIRPYNGISMDRDFLNCESLLVFEKMDPFA